MKYKRFIVTNMDFADLLLGQQTTAPVDHDCMMPDDDAEGRDSVNGDQGGDPSFQLGRE